MTKEEADETATYTMLQIATWICGALSQGEKLLAIQSRQSTAGRFDRTGTVIEEEFFVVSARKLIRWIAEADKQTLVPTNAFKRLRRIAPTIADVRDMREHADDYIVRKKGRKQADFHYSPKDENVRVAYSSDATAAIILDGNYLIGGRLNVQEVLKAVLEARAEFEVTICNDKRFSWLSSVLGS